MFSTVVQTLVSNQALETRIKYLKSESKQLMVLLSCEETEKLNQTIAFHIHVANARHEAPTERLRRRCSKTTQRCPSWCFPGLNAD